MIMIILRTMRTLAALAFEPIPAHAAATETCQSASTKLGKSVDRQKPGERGDRPDSTPTVAPSPAIPDVELVPGWVAHPAWRDEFTDEQLAYRLAVWTEQVSR